MIRIKLTPNFRKIFCEKLMDLGNLAIVSLAFGQFIGSKEFSLILLISGVSLMFGCYFVSYMLNS